MDNENVAGRPSQHSQEFIELMNECIQIHYKKSYDYSQEGNPFSNFERAAKIIEWFKNPIDQVFAGIIGIKLARLAELRNGKIAKNESEDDTFKDSVNYFALWGAYWRRDRKESGPGQTKLYYCDYCEGVFHHEPIWGSEKINATPNTYCSGECAARMER